MIKLTKAQIRFIMTNWFNTYDLEKIFMTSDLSWLEKQDIRLNTDKINDWSVVYMNSKKMTTINNDGGKFKELYKQFLKIK